ncbi:MAG: hypothetical protein GWN01_01460 [Nitrosopumilaceae archaeon]|nr:hypothetical protein [Nitrosopumilaceae archaeon]NIU86026.1 hypothetical protein [Nitrosopumilaceae archaeon]NIX60245.1 hypothetical protein [Nitrosopumilaceae archaeon]
MVKRNKPLYKSVRINESYKIETIRVINGKVYLKISDSKYNYKWIDYHSSDNNSEIVEGRKV